MRVLNVMPISYKGASVRKDNNNTNSMPYVSKVNFGNAFSELPKNFGTVIEKTLFRGGLPETFEHFKALKEQGVTFILDLCRDNMNEAIMAKSLGIDDYTYIDGDILSKSKNKEKLSQVIQIIDEKIRAGGVGYIHCGKGTDRTGFFVAHYQAKILKMPMDKIIDHYTDYGGDYLSFCSFEKSLTN